MSWMPNKDCAWLIYVLKTGRLHRVGHIAFHPEITGGFEAVDYFPSRYLTNGGGADRRGTQDLGFSAKRTEYRGIRIKQLVNVLFTGTERK